MAAATPPPPAWVPATATPYAAAYSMAPSRRVQQNLQPLGVMWCVYGVYRLFAILIAGFVFHAMVGGGAFQEVPEFAAHMLRSLVPVIGFVSVVMSGMAMLTGYALITRKPWGRVMAIVLGILALIKIPFGTALGIYTLWVLAPQASGAEWDTMTGTQS